MTNLTAAFRNFANAAKNLPELQSLSCGALPIGSLSTPQLSNSGKINRGSTALLWANRTMAYITVSEQRLKVEEVLSLNGFSVQQTKK